MSEQAKIPTNNRRNISGFRISKRYVFRFVFLAIAVAGLLLNSIFAFSFRVEMITKVFVLTFASATLPRLKLGAAATPIALALAVITIFLWGVDIENKALARSVIVLVMIPAIFRIDLGLWFYLLATIAMWSIQELSNSRGLQLTVILFLGQLALYRFWKFPILIYLTPIVYISGLAILGALYIAGLEILSATASNLGRSTMIFVVINNILSFPFGYTDESQYLSYLSELAINLYSDVYNDPHNFYLTAAVWGGIPLLFLSIWGTYSLLSATLHTGNVTHVSIFAHSALMVALSTSTLSISNAFFFIFVIFFVTQFGGDRISCRIRLRTKTSTEEF